MRDEVDLIMKRLRIPWREGGQVKDREKRESQKETEVERERLKRQEVQYLATGST